MDFPSPGPVLCLLTLPHSSTLRHLPLRSVPCPLSIPCPSSLALGSPHFSLTLCCVCLSFYLLCPVPILLTCPIFSPNTPIHVIVFNSCFSTNLHPLYLPSLPPSLAAPHLPFTLPLFSSLETAVYLWGTPRSAPMQTCLPLSRHLKTALPTAPQACWAHPMPSPSPTSSASSPHPSWLYHLASPGPPLACWPTLPRWQRPMSKKAERQKFSPTEAGAQVGQAGTHGRGLPLLPAQGLHPGRGVPNAANAQTHDAPPTLTRSVGVSLLPSECGWFPAQGFGGAVAAPRIGGLTPL